MPVLQVGGLSSGLDTNKIIDQLISIAERPKTRLESKVAELQSQKMSIQTVDASLLALQTQVALLSNGNSLLSSKVTSSDTSSASAAISSSVNPDDVALGTYEIEVIRLAEPYKIANDIANREYISKAIAQGEVLNNAGFRIKPTEGSFSINGKVITIDPGSDTLDSVIGKINTSGAGVTASYDNGIDKITIKNSTNGDKSVITLGAASDTSNFLSAVGLLNAPQMLDGNGTNAVESFNRMGLVDKNSPLAGAHTAYQGITSGNFYINNVEITIDHTTESLQDIIDKINSSQAGVTASYNILTDQFELTSNVGSAQVSLSNGTSNFLEAMRLLDNTGAIIGFETLGQTAQFKVNGTLVEQNSNTGISGVISGVTLNLLAVTTNPVQLTIERDVDSVVSAVRSFINQYNSTQSVLREAIQNGDLRGDTSISRISQRLFRMMIQPIGGLPTNFNQLSDIGIARAKANTVTVDSVKSGLEFSILDESKLRNAIAENPTAVADMFRTTGSGETTTVSKAFQLVFPARRDSNEIVVSGYVDTSEDFNTGDKITILDGKISEELTISGIAYNTLDNAGWGITPTSGKFIINGQEIQINVETQTIYDVVNAINAAGTSNPHGADFKAYYDHQTGRLTLRNATDGDTSTLELSVPDENASNFPTAAGWLNANQTLITTDPETGNTIDPANSVSSSVGIGRTTITLGSNLTNDYTTSAVVGKEGADGVTLTKQTVGFAAGMENLLKTYTQTSTGVIDSRLEIYDRRIENAQNRLDEFDVKMEQLRAKYVEEFARLESALATLQSQSSYVSQQLYSLQNSLLFSFNRGLY